MSLLLAINTASAACTIVVSRNGMLNVRHATERRMAAARILPLIDELMRAEQIVLADLDGLAVVTGPGSFTGMRIGVAVAQGLSFSADLPLVPISSLALTARQVALTHPNPTGDWLIGQAAREDELYLGAFRVEAEGLLKQLGEEWVGEPAGLKARLQELQQANWSLAGTVFRERDSLIEALAVRAERIVPDPPDSVRALCLLGEEGLAAGRAVVGEQLLPNYVKEQMNYRSGS